MPSAESSSRVAAARSSGWRRFFSRTGDDDCAFACAGCSFFVGALRLRGGGGAGFSSDRRFVFMRCRRGGSGAFSVAPLPLKS